MYIGAELEEWCRAGKGCAGSLYLSRSDAAGQVLTGLGLGAGSKREGWMQQAGSVTDV